ncbi:hypothetical protein [uncultured Microbacterium sp.]|uniref:glycosyltransferase family protein n=1 Tax=uncultured Microbacterium sp. TaxID=191216 RepID=UPI002620E2D6|nr:hypothetical protein [uncultured Microbacterium sp.]
MRLLLVSPSFFGYQADISRAFERRGWTVDLIDERPSNSSWARAAVRIAPLMLKRSIERHYRANADLLNKHRYHALLVVKGEVVPAWFIELFRSRNPAATSAYYTFDAIANSPQGARIFDKFDFRYTFDRSDVASYPTFTYKPLFYVPDYSPGKRTRDLMVSFVGTLHGERFRFAKAATASVAEEDRELFFYSQAPWYFWFKRLTSREVRPISRREVSFEPLSRAAGVELSQRSRAVLDLQRSGQAGLTMRTFETLAAGAALITTNEMIRAEPFYDEDRILVVPRNPESVDPEAVAEFIDRAPVGIAPPGFSSYSLDSWVAEFDDLFQRSAS